MKHVEFMPTARILAAVLVLCLGQTALAAPLVSLKGNTEQARSVDDSEVRLSVLSYDDSGSGRELVEKFREYQAEPDHEAFGKYLRERETRGYVFSKEATGYSIKYAWQDPAASGERLVLVVTPALKTLNPYLWKSRNETEAPFTVLELDVEGEQAVVKTSLDTPISISEDGNHLSLQDFDAAETFATLRDNTPYYLKDQS